MKIAFFTDTYEPQINGAVVSIKSFAEQLKKDGHEVHIFCPQAEGLKEGEFIHTTPSVKLYLYPEYRVGFPNKKFYDIAKKIQPDIIHVHSLPAIGLTGVAIAKKLKIPLFITYHTMVNEFLQYIPGAKISEELSKKTLDKYTAWFLNNADFVFSPGTTTKNYLKKIGMRTPVEVLQTGVSLKKFPAEKKILQPTILHIGRLSSEKSVDLVVRAFARIKEKTNANLVITSDGPDRRELEQLASELGLSSRIIFTGYISEREKENLYKKSTCLVMTSSADTQGIVPLEAMSFGLPVVVAKAGGLIDLVSNGKNGLFFRTGSEDDLAEKILKVLNSRSLQKKLSTGGIETAKNLSIENRTAKLESFYEKFLPSKMFSVIIPTYLEEKYIKKTLEAVRSQSYRNFEIIVLDSNSRDRTLAIARRYADKIINLKERGVSLARNTGAKASKGDLLLFLDADTIMEKDFLKRIAKVFDNKRVVATSGYVYASGSIVDRIIFLGTSEISWLTAILGFPLFHGMCMTVRRDIFEKVRGFNLKYETAEDIDLTERVRKYGTCVLVRNARALTSARRTQKMGSLYSIYYHITNFLRYKYFGEGRKDYPTTR